jgi:hypothetical protein
VPVEEPSTASIADIITVESDVTQIEKIWDFYPVGQVKLCIMDTYLQFLTEDSTVLGMTFHNWIPLVAVILII